MNVVYSPRAMHELQGISAYLAERNPDGAINVLRAIKSSIETLSFFPQIGRVVDNVGHRRLPVLRYPYLIYYRIADEELLILHIRHSSRRPINLPTDL
jgi:toxin ParE1/3/4